MIIFRDHKFLFDLLNRYYENVFFFPDEIWFFFFFFFFFFETLFRKIRFPKKLPVRQILIRVVPMDSVAFHLPACMKFRAIFTLPYPTSYGLRKASQLGTFFTFLPIFSEIFDFLKNYPSRFGIKGLIDRPGCRKLPCTSGWSLICLGEEL